MHLAYLATLTAAIAEPRYLWRAAYKWQKRQKHQKQKNRQNIPISKASENLQSVTQHWSRCTVGYALASIPVLGLQATLERYSIEKVMIT